MYSGSVVNMAGVIAIRPKSKRCAAMLWYAGFIFS